MYIRSHKYYLLYFTGKLLLQRLIADNTDSITLELDSCQIICQVPFICSYFFHLGSSSGYASRAGTNVNIVKCLAYDRELRNTVSVPCKRSNTPSTP